MYHVEPQNARYQKFRWLGLAVISLAVALIIMDSTIVSVAVPAVVADLGLSSTQIQWIQEIYTLVFASLLLVWGRVADRVGRRKMLLIGLLIFLVSSALCAMAPTGTMLVLARAVQGVGGSMILPTTLSLVNANFRGKERTIAFAIWGSTIGGMAAVGPMLGGWLTTAYSWNWAFLVNIPLSLIAFVGIMCCVGESKELATGKLDDYLGAVLSVLGFGSLAFGLIEGRTYGWWSAEASAPLNFGGLSPIPLVFLFSVLALVAFIFWELARARAQRSVLLDISLFSIGSFARGNITALTVSLGEFGLILSLPLWFQNVLGLSALQAGFALVPLAVGSFVASGATQALARKLAPVRLVQIGVGLEILSIACLALLIRPDSSTWLTSSILFFYGIGVGFATAQLTQVILADVPVQYSGQASSTQSTSRQVGSALGIAILGTALFSTLQNTTESQLASTLAQNPQLREAVDSVAQSSGGSIAALAANPQTAAIADAAKLALTDGVALAGWIAAGVLFLGFLTTLGQKSPRREQAASEATRA